MDTFTSAAELIGVRPPDNPVLGHRPHVARRAANWFLNRFPGKILYAVKANNAPAILEAVYRAGVRDYDVASLREIEQLSGYPGARLYLMNPVSPRNTIARAYFDYGVRDFALDSFTELQKISEVTGGAKDLTLHVRTRCDGDGAVMALGPKFGAEAEIVGDLMMAARRASCRLGLTFHVGSQAMEPACYTKALMDLDQLIVHAGVLPDVIDVGGGFPVPYTSLEPLPLACYVDAIEKGIEAMCVTETCELQCEPGRAIAAGSGSVVVRVDRREGDVLYINDGAYGALFDAAHFGFIYPAKRIGSKEGDQELRGFSFFGPTCDSFDKIDGPFMLPADIAEGDYIEIGQLGAYGGVMASQFNGFGVYDEAVLLDEPMVGLRLEETDMGAPTALQPACEANVR